MNMALDERIGRPNWHPNRYYPILICNAYAIISEQSDFLFGSGVTRCNGGDHFHDINGTLMPLSCSQRGGMTATAEGVS